MQKEKLEGRQPQTIAAQARAARCDHQESVLSRSNSSLERDLCFISLQRDIEALKVDVLSLLVLHGQSSGIKQSPHPPCIFLLLPVSPKFSYSPDSLS